MITLKQTIVVTHDDPYADFCRRNLTKESGWIVKMEDTIAVSYEQTKYYKTLDGDMKITYPIGENRMKAILVIEMPNDCNECPLNSNGYCDVLQEYALLNEWVEDAPYYSLKEKGVCPLKPLPEKKELANYLPFEDYPQQIRFMDFVNGWNACLEEIEK